MYIVEERIQLSVSVLPLTNCCVTLRGHFNLLRPCFLKDSVKQFVEMIKLVFSIWFSVLLTPVFNLLFLFLKNVSSNIKSKCGKDDFLKFKVDEKFVNCLFLQGRGSRLHSSGSCLSLCSSCVCLLIYVLQLEICSCGSWLLFFQEVFLE